MTGGRRHRRDRTDREEGETGKKDREEIRGSGDRKEIYNCKGILTLEPGDEKSYMDERDQVPSVATSKVTADTSPLRVGDGSGLGLQGRVCGFQPRVLT